MAAKHYIGVSPDLRDTIDRVKRHFNAIRFGAGKKDLTTQQFLELVIRCGEVRRTDIVECEPTAKGPGRPRVRR